MEQNIQNKLIMIFFSYMMYICQIFSYYYHKQKLQFHITDYSKPQIFDNAKINIYYYKREEKYLGQNKLDYIINGVFFDFSDQNIEYLLNQGYQFFIKNNNSQRKTEHRILGLYFNTDVIKLKNDIFDWKKIQDKETVDKFKKQIIGSDNIDYNVTQNNAQQKIINYQKQQQQSQYLKINKEEDCQLVLLEHNYNKVVIGTSKTILTFSDDQYIYIYQIGLTNKVEILKILKIENLETVDKKQYKIISVQYQIKDSKVICDSMKQSLNMTIANVFIIFNYYNRGEEITKLQFEEVHFGILTQIKHNTIVNYNIVMQEHYEHYSNTIRKEELKYQKIQFSGPQQQSYFKIFDIDRYYFEFVVGKTLDHSQEQVKQVFWAHEYGDIVVESYLQNGVLEITIKKHEDNQLDYTIIKLQDNYKCQVTEIQKEQNYKQSVFYYIINQHKMFSENTKSIKYNLYKVNSVVYSLRLSKIIKYHIYGGQHVNKIFKLQL